MGCRKSKPQPVSREWGQEGAPARQGGGVGVEEEVDQVLAGGGGRPALQPGDRRRGRGE